MRRVLPEAKAKHFSEAKIGDIGLVQHGKGNALALCITEGDAAAIAVIVQKTDTASQGRPTRSFIIRQPDFPHWPIAIFFPNAFIDLDVSSLNFKYAEEMFEPYWQDEDLIIMVPDDGLPFSPGVRLNISKSNLEPSRHRQGGIWSHNSWSIRLPTDSMAVASQALFQLG